MSLRLVKMNEEIAVLRQRYKESYFNRIYSGWSDIFDQSFDEHSEWFISDSNDAFCRVTYKVKGNNLPMELGQCELGIGADDLVCEINNFTYTNQKNAIPFMNSVFSHVHSIGVENIYCLVDPNWKKAKKLNIEEFNFIQTELSQIFMDIKYKKSELPVKWQVLFQDKKSRLRIITDEKAIKRENCQINESLPR